MCDGIVAAVVAGFVQQSYSRSLTVRIVSSYLPSRIRMIPCTKNERASAGCAKPCRKCDDDTALGTPVVVGEMLLVRGSQV